MPIQAVNGDILPANALSPVQAPKLRWPGLPSGLLAAVTLPLWLVMAVVAAVLLLVMLVGDALRPGGAAKRRPWRTGVLF